MGGHSNLVGEKMLTWFTCNYLSPIAEKTEYLWVNLIKKHIIIITIFPFLQAWTLDAHSLNSRDIFLNLRRLVKMTKPLRFENKSLRLKYKCLICIWIIFWAILDLFINPKYLFQNKSFSQTYYFKSEKSFVILTSLLGLEINPREFREHELGKYSCSKVLFCFDDYVVGLFYLVWFCFFESNYRL